MAAKPELSAGPGVQNVVVYVSNDSFGQQTYAVGQEHVQNAGFTNPPHSLVDPSKTYHQDKLKTDYLNGHHPHNYFTTPTGLIPQQAPNGFPLQISYHHNGTIVNQTKNTYPVNTGNGDVLSGERQAGPGRPPSANNKILTSSDNTATFVDSTNSYMTTTTTTATTTAVMGADAGTQSGVVVSRCDSVRSETAESSCSSLSSVDEGIVVVQNHQPSEMVVYDSSVSVRPGGGGGGGGGVVLAVGGSSTAGCLNQQQQQQLQTTNANLISVGNLSNNNINNQQSFVSVPSGWKRLLNNGSVIYISPSNTALSSAEQVKEYLLSTGTCKCGLECHFKYDSIFNFDPKVASKPWILSPDTNTGDLTKLCNHKRKIITMASLDCKPPDPNIRLRKDYNNKRSKRKSSLSFTGNNISVPYQGQREKLGLNHHYSKEHSIANNQTQVWSQLPVANTNPLINNRLQNYSENSLNQQQLVKYHDHSIGNRLLTTSPLIVGDNVMVQPSSTTGNISQQQQQQQTEINLQNQNQIRCNNNNNNVMTNYQNSSNNIHLHHQQLIGPNGQLISVQSPINSNQMLPTNGQSINHMLSSNNGVVIQGQTQQHRIYVNGQPNEPSGPGRPNLQIIPVSIANQQQQQQQQKHEVQFRMQQQQQQYYNNQAQYSHQIHQCDSSKHIRPSPPFNNNNPLLLNGYRSQLTTNQQQNNQQILQTSVMINRSPSCWLNRPPPPPLLPQQQQQQNQMIFNQTIPNIYDRVPPLHQHHHSNTSTPLTHWQDEIKRKKVKLGKLSIKNRSYHQHNNNNSNNMIECPTIHPSCPNIDIRQITTNENLGRTVIINSINNNTQTNQNNTSLQSPSFMEDPSGYLAQQTALLNNTINRQTGGGSSTCPPGIICTSPTVQNINTIPVTNSQQTNEVPLPSNVVIKQQQQQQHQNKTNQNIIKVPQQQNIVISSSPQQQQQQQQYNQIITQGIADSSANDQQIECQSCIPDSGPQQQQQHHQQIIQGLNSAPNSGHSTPNLDDPVTSSTTYNNNNNNNTERKLSSHSTTTSSSPPDNRPIQGGTISTSNVSPIENGRQTDSPSTSPNNQHTSPTPINQQQQQQQRIHNCCSIVASSPLSNHCNTMYLNGQYANTGIVTTMASGRTVGSNTITSVLAGRANTATVSINNPAAVTTIGGQHNNQQNHSISLNVSKSPLEMVQSVVSSIQVPYQTSPSPQISPPQQHVTKQHTATNLPPGHILVSSGGQLIMASTGTVGGTSGSVNMPPPAPPKLNSMPPISVSPMITNVTATVSQVIPAVAAQQMLGQQTVLVNTLPTPQFVLQPGVAMTMDGMTVTNQNTMQLPQLVAGNVIQQQIQIDNGDSVVRRNVPALLSPPEVSNTGGSSNNNNNKKKGKKRKISSQTVAGMLQIAAAQQQQQQQQAVAAAAAAGVVQMTQQTFPQQIQMAHHSPQGLAHTANGGGPQMMQALTIVPSKNGGPPQIVMNGGQGTTQQLITTNSQATPPQINLLQPVNLINTGTTSGLVQNFPTIQQFIVPNLGGSSMVMNPDGTATILQDTTNLGMQLQLQNVNGQNVLTPIQSNGMFNGGQSILAAGPAGMVIRTPPTSQGKIMQHHSQQQHQQQQQQQHSPGQFLSPNGSQFVAQFNGQLSPLIANVSPTQQLTFGTTSTTTQQQQQQQIRPNNNNSTQQQQEFIQCGQLGQTLMVPSHGNVAVSSTNQQQNTTFVQQNTTIVQQQTTMVSNNQQQIQNFHQSNTNQQQQQTNLGGNNRINVDQNFIISSNDSMKQQQQQQQQAVQALLIQKDNNQHQYRQSVSTQTAVNQSTQSVTTNTFCQTSSTPSIAGSPPDTTTLSPLASGGQSPLIADTTTHSGTSTDDGLSPAPSSGGCSLICDISTSGKQQQQQQPSSTTAMAMVHCISSSEPDSADLLNQSQNSDSHDWTITKNNTKSSSSSTDFLINNNIIDGQIYLNTKKSSLNSSNSITYAAESSTGTSLTGLQFINEQTNSNNSKSSHDEIIVSSNRDYDKMLHNKRKTSTHNNNNNNSSSGGDTLLIMETHHNHHLHHHHQQHHMHSSLFDDEDKEKTNTSSRNFVVGDLVWGPTKSCPAWPGKVIEVNGNIVTIKWFGNDKLMITNLNKRLLQTLSEGLDAHHHARKKCRTSRKLNSHLEIAIQQAMSELDKDLEDDSKNKKSSKSLSVNSTLTPSTTTTTTATTTTTTRKTSNRLRNNNR